jgi:hypothetical protein
MLRAYSASSLPAPIITRDVVDASPRADYVRKGTMEVEEWVSG